MSDQIEEGLPFEILQLGPALAVGTTALEKRHETRLDSVTQLEAPMRRLSTIITFARFYRGDLMLLSEGLFGEEAAQIVDAEHLTEAEAKAEKFVASKVKPTTRTHAQSWDHARVVALLSDEKQVDWLQRSKGDNWSAGKLATELAKASATGKTVMRWWLVVECRTEALRDKVAAELERRGHRVKRQEKLAKVAKPARAKKGPVTAQKKHKGAPKRNTRRRVPR